MKILMVASECVPFVKVGGLADVVGTLSRYLKKAKNDVRIILPAYQKIDRKKYPMKKVKGRLIIPIGDHYEEAEVLLGQLGKPPEAVPVYFINAPKYFDRPEVYRTSEGDFADNAERFIFFSRAALETAKLVDFQPEIIHSHDWQTGLIPAYLKTLYRIDAFFQSTRTVFTIHNIAYQGMFPAETMTLAGFSWDEFSPDKMEYYGQMNFLKIALVYADGLTTVSPTYAQEIKSGPEFGRGMEGILNARAEALKGILNGIDYEEWNPATDPHIAARFSPKDIKGKAICKADLQNTVGLARREKAMVVGVVSRLDPQKGFDLVSAALPEIIKRDIQVVILGVGDKEIQENLSRLVAAFPNKISLNLKFDNDLAHKIYAGSDVFLMPSRFEPCGLGQMIALAYGTIPIVNRTGGLADTIVDFSVQNSVVKGNGFVLKEPTVAALIEAGERAISVYNQESRWKQLLNNAFKSKFSWSESSKLYLKLYRSL